VRKAIALDDTLAEAHALMGYLFSIIGKYDKALAEGERAVALNPNSAESYFRLGKVLTFSGRYEKSIPQYKRAMRLNPIPPNMYFYSLGLSYGWTAQYEEAITWCIKATRLEPNSLWAHIMMAAVYSLSGRDEEARAEAAEILRINPSFSLAKVKFNYKKKTDRERFLGALRKAGLK